MSDKRRFTDQQAKAATRWPILDGDDSPRKELFDKVVVAAKDHVCDNCRGPIRKGDHSRASKILFHDDGKFQTFRWCFDCCNTGDDFKLLCDRYNLFSEPAPMSRADEYDETTKRG